jgi:hypothetical protein
LSSDHLRVSAGFSAALNAFHRIEVQLEKIRYIEEPEKHTHWRGHRPSSGIVHHARTDEF